MATKQRSPKSFRLSEDGEQLLDALAKKLGVKQTAIMEIAIRQMAQREEVSLPKSSEQGE